MNLYVLMKLMKGQLPDDEKLQLDGHLVTKVKTYFHEHVDSLDMSQEGILMRKVQGIAGEERRLILLPQLFHREVILNAHDRQGHQGADKTVSCLQVRFDWPGIYHAVQKYIGSCPDCQACKGSKASRPFSLKSIVT